MALAHYRIYELDPADHVLAGWRSAWKASKCGRGLWLSGRDYLKGGRPLAGRRG